MCCAYLSIFAHICAYFAHILQYIWGKKASMVTKVQQPTSPKNEEIFENFFKRWIKYAHNDHLFLLFKNTFSIYFKSPWFVRYMYFVPKLSQNLGFWYLAHILAHICAYSAHILPIFFGPASAHIPPPLAYANFFWHPLRPFLSVLAALLPPTRANQKY